MRVEFLKAARAASNNRNRYVQFHDDGFTYKAVSISGPTHNFLGVEFVPPGAVARPVLIEPVRLFPTEPIRLAADEVLLWVEQGMKEAGEELGVEFRLSRIIYVVSDSPPVEVYRDIAKRIAHRMHARRQTKAG